MDGGDQLVSAELKCSVPVTPTLFCRAGLGPASEEVRAQLRLKGPPGPPCQLVCTENFLNPPFKNTRVFLLFCIFTLFVYSYSVVHKPVQHVNFTPTDSVYILFQLFWGT